MVRNPQSYRVTGCSPSRLTSIEQRFTPGPPGSAGDSLSRAGRLALQKFWLRALGSWRKNIAVAWAVGRWGGTAPQQRTVGRRPLAWLRLRVGLLTASGLWTSPLVGAAADGPALTAGAVAFVRFMRFGSALCWPGVGPELAGALYDYWGAESCSWVPRWGRSRFFCWVGHGGRLGPPAAQAFRKAAGDWSGAREPGGSSWCAHRVFAPRSLQLLNLVYGLSGEPAGLR